MKTLKTNKQSGFTMVEILVAAALFVLVTAMILITFIGLAESSSMTTANSEMHSGIRNGLDIISKDIRKSSSVLSCYDNHYILLQVEESSGATTNFYYIYDSNLLRIINWQWPSEWPLVTPVIASCVTNITFSLYKKDGTATTVASEAAMIDVTINTSASVRSKTYSDTLRTRVMMRNK